MKNGVSFYTHGSARIVVHFPEGDECCRWCPLFLRYEENFKRYSCRLTGEWIIEPQHERGEQCPLEMGDEHGNSSDDFGRERDGKKCQPAEF